MEQSKSRVAVAGGEATKSCLVAAHFLEPKRMQLRDDETALLVAEQFAGAFQHELLRALSVDLDQPRCGQSSRLPFRIEGGRSYGKPDGSRLSLDVARKLTDVPQRTSAAVIAVDEECYLADPVGDRLLDNRDIGAVVEHQIASKPLHVAGIGLERHNMAARTDQQCGQNREISGIGTDIGDDIAGAEHLNEDIRYVRLETGAALQFGQDASLVRPVGVQIKLHRKCLNRALVDRDCYDRHRVLRRPIVSISQTTIRERAKVSMEARALARSARSWEHQAPLRPPARRSAP